MQRERQVEEAQTDQLGLLHLSLCQETAAFHSSNNPSWISQRGCFLDFFWQIIVDDDDVDDVMMKMTLMVGGLWLAC